MFLVMLTILLQAFALEVPQQLTANQQVRLHEIVGLGTSPKFQSKAYSLGGYSGFEIGLSADYLQTGEVSTFGSRSTRSNDSVFPVLQIAKGVFNNSDIIFHFAPSFLNANLNRFGLSYRWMFYEADYLPIHLSVVSHGGSANLADQMITRSLGMDLLLGLSFDEWSLFMGAGGLNSSAQFTGGPSGVTLSQRVETRRISVAHFNFGATYQWSSMLFTLAVDRYVDEVFSFKTSFLF